MRNAALRALLPALGVIALGCSTATTALPRNGSGTKSATGETSATEPAAASTTTAQQPPTTTTSLVAQLAAPVTAAATSSSIPASSSSSTTTTTIDPAVRAQLENSVAHKFRAKAALLMRSGVTALGFALVKDGRVVDAVSLGKNASGAPLDTTARFRIGSISKTITAMTVMALVDQGKLSLDAPLKDQWSGTLSVADKRFRTITIRQLLQHTSGVPELRSYFFTGGAKDWHEAARHVLQTKLAHRPGGGYKYSNGNYVVLGLLIEQASGKTVEQAAQDLVLEPLGIHGAAFSGTKVTDLTGPAYHVSNRRTYMESLGPAGAWTMSPTDTALLFSALHPHNASSVVPVSIRNRMRHPWAPAGQVANSQYGLGLERFGTLWGHTGTLQAARTAVFMLPNGYTFCVLTGGEALAKGKVVLTLFASEISAARALPA
jgi:D-alanyl-D-alanine carboxypeptidase